MKLIKIKYNPKVYNYPQTFNVHYFDSFFLFCYGNPIFEETNYPKFTVNKNFPEGGDLVKVEWEKRTTITYFCDLVAGGKDYSGDGSKENPYRSLAFIISRWSRYFTSDYNFFIKIYIKGIFDYTSHIGSDRIYLQPWEEEQFYFDYQKNGPTPGIWNGIEYKNTVGRLSFFCSAAINSSFYATHKQDSLGLTGNYYLCNFSFNYDGLWEDAVVWAGTRIFVKSNFLIIIDHYPDICLPAFPVAQDCTFVIHVDLKDCGRTGWKGRYVLFDYYGYSSLKLSKCHFEVHIDWGNHKKIPVYIFLQGVTQKDCTFSGDVDGLFAPE